METNINNESEIPQDNVELNKEIEMNDDGMKKKDLSDISGYVDRKNMDVILSHVENELKAVEGKL